MRYGIDIDGVLANFQYEYNESIISVTGKDLFPPRPFDAEMWFYPEHYGYTEHEMANVWRAIKEDRSFWSRLPTYPETQSALSFLSHRMDHGDDVYFITDRPGLDAKVQTEGWLEMHWPIQYTPPLTVILSSRKDLCAEALNLDFYIDDRDVNVQSVAQLRNFHDGRFVERTRTFLLDRSWNQSFDERPLAIHRVNLVSGMEG